MRRHIRTLLLALLLLAGCSKTVTPPPQTQTPPAPAVQGVALANLDLKNAPALSIEQVPPPHGNGPAPDLTDVAFSSGSAGYAVTHSGTIAKTTDGGASWTEVYHLEGGRFSQVQVAGTQAVFAVAQTGCDPGPNCEGPPVLLRSTDGGQHWTVLQPELPPVPMPAGTQAAAFPWLRFQFVSAQVGYAAGDIRENVVMRAPPLMVTRDGGQTWQVVRLPDGLSQTGGFTFVSPERGYVTARHSESGAYQVLATDDGGKTWRTLYSTKEFGLYAVDFPTATDGYVGGGLNPRTAAQPRQVVLATHDGGATWTLVSRTEDKGSPVVELRMINAAEGWAARGGCWSMGANGPCGGRLYFTRDGGRSWTDTGHDVRRIRSAGQRTWAIDERGATTLMRTDDGGVTWQQLARPDAVRVSQVWFLDTQVGFIGTNLGLYQTTDFGKTWSPYPVGAGLPPESWPLFLDRQTALGLTQRGLERSSDGGRTWQPLKPGPPARVRQMAFADSQNGVALPWGNKLLLTADGGRTWTQQVADKDLSLHQASYAGSRDRLWLAGTYFPGDYTITGVLLHSTDGGQHWVAWRAKEVIFQQIQFVTAQDGWAVTQASSGSGLLTTHDGGRTWTEVWPKIPMQR